LCFVDRPKLPLLVVREDREGMEEGEAEGGVVMEVLAAIDDVAEVFHEGLAGGGLEPADFHPQAGGFGKPGRARQVEREVCGREHCLPGVSRRWGPRESRVVS